MTTRDMLWTEFKLGIQKLDTPYLSVADGEAAVMIAQTLYGKTSTDVSALRARRASMNEALHAIIRIKQDCG